MTSSGSSNDGGYGKCLSPLLKLAPIEGLAESEADALLIDWNAYRFSGGEKDSPVYHDSTAIGFSMLAMERSNILFPEQAIALAAHSCTGFGTW